MTRVGLILAVEWGKKPIHFRHTIVAVASLTEELIARTKLRDTWEYVFPTEWTEVKQ